MCKYLGLFFLLMSLLICESAISGPFSVRLQDVARNDVNYLGKVNLYHESYALVVGIDQYNNGWPKLRNAVNDAHAVSKVLENIGFEVKLALNLNSEDLAHTVKRFFIKRGKNPNARLILWFAGHGHTVNGEGFLIASDTPVESKADFKLKAIHMRDFGSWVRLAESKHVLAVFDSCFSGTVFSGLRSKPPAAITRATLFPVRQFITSGDVDQLVLDDGTFKDVFVRALINQEEADANRDGYLTGSELGLYISDKITNLTQGNQTPRYGMLMDKRYIRGDIVIVNFNINAERLSGVKEFQSDKESMLWRSAEEMNHKGAYQAYLAQFPRGVFASIAKLKIKTLEQSQFGALNRSSNRIFKSVQLISKGGWGYGAPSENSESVHRFKSGDELIGKARIELDGHVWYQLESPVGIDVYVREDTVEVKGGELKKPSMNDLIEQAKIRIEKYKNEERKRLRKEEENKENERKEKELKVKKCNRKCQSESNRDIKDTARWQDVIRNCNFSTIDQFQYNICLEQQYRSEKATILQRCLSQCG